MQSASQACSSLTALEWLTRRCRLSAAPWACAGVDVQSIKQAKMLAKMRMLEERGSEFCSRTIRDLSASLGSDGGFLFEGRVAKMSVLELAHTFMDPNTSKCAQLRGRAAHSLSPPGCAHGVCMHVISQSERVLAAVEHDAYHCATGLVTTLFQPCHNRLNRKCWPPAGCVLAAGCCRLLAGCLLLIGLHILHQVRTTTRRESVILQCCRA